MVHRNLAFVILTGILVSSSSSGHDLWLIPPAKVVPKQKAQIAAGVGMDFPVSEFASATDRYPRKFVLAPDGGTLPLTSAGKKGLVSFLEFKPAAPGIHLLAVQTTPKILELDAERFNEYLVTDGLPHIYRLRAKEKGLNQAAKERYSKSPTALVSVGASKTGDWGKVLDLPLQIVPMQNPFESKVGATLRIRVYFQKKPLTRAHVGWQRPGDGDTPIGYVRTDAQGEALIPISQTGLMTIRLTHMTRPKLADYEWESFWTTLTFRIP